MPKLLIDILPAQGHFHATLKIATLLKNAGYEVVYGTDYVLQDQIEKFGFGFEYLPFNEAIAFPTEDTDKYPLYTIATKLKHGWMWNTPTQGRWGNGYVFNGRQVRQIVNILSLNLSPRLRLNLSLSLRIIIK